MISDNKVSVRLLRKLLSKKISPYRFLSTSFEGLVPLEYALVPPGGEGDHEACEVYLWHWEYGLLKIENDILMWESSLGQAIERNLHGNPALSIKENGLMPAVSHVAIHVINNARPEQNCLRIYQFDKTLQEEWVKDNPIDYSL